LNKLVPPKKTTATPRGSGCGLDMGVSGKCGQKTGTFFPITYTPRNNAAFFDEAG